MGREEWLIERKKGLGGSDASSIIGRNPYQDIQKLYDIKMGLIEPEDIGHKPYVKYGNDAEPYLRGLFALDFPKYEVSHEEYKLVKHPEYEFLFGSLDGELTDKETGEKGVLEIKTTNILRSMHMEKWNDRIPDNYFVQILHYMLVTGYTFAILVAQLKTEYQGIIKKTTRHYYINREDHLDDIEMLKNAEIKFWNENIMKGIRPSLILPNI